MIVNGGGRKDEMTERINQLMLLQLEKTLNEEGIPRAASGGAASGGSAVMSKFKNFQSQSFWCLTFVLCCSRALTNPQSTKEKHSQR